MYTQAPLLLFLVASLSAAPTDASLLARSTNSIVRAASRARSHVARRSTGFINDLQLAYAGLVVQSQDQNSGGQYCHPLNGSGLSGQTPNTTSSASAPAPTGVDSPWKLAQSYEGSTFFAGWSFFTYPDPTGGDVQYIDGPTAGKENLTSVNDAGNAILRVDTTPQVQGNRQSVRITTEYSFTEGLVILDAVHAPTGCGTWPAFWTNGPNWPAGGEIDIMEGVNSYTNNQATLHTSSGCSLPTADATALAITGTVIDGTDCSVADTGDTGCGIRANQTNSFGSGFNSANGGVYAMEWAETAISVYFFPRSSIPSDITAGTPLPSGWGLPMANFPATSCNITSHFFDHSIIFDTTLCGAWAGSDWADTGAPGQAQSCAQITNTASCTEYVQNNGAAFNEAYWEIKSVKVYQLSS